MKNFLLAFRTIRNYRFYSTVNILGLALSLACVITISRYVTSEYLTDQFHNDPDQIYVTFRQDAKGGDSRITSIDGYSSKADGTSIDLRRDAAVEYCTEIEPFPDAVLTYNKRQWVAKAIYCDTALTKVFNFPLESGSLKRVLEEPNFVAISSELALKIFGNEDPIGKSIDFNDKTATIEAVFAPAKSSITFDLISSKMTLHETRYMSLNFIRIARGIDIEAFNERYKVIGEQESGDSEGFFQVRPFTSLYFDSSNEAHFKFLLIHGNRDSLNVLIIVAIAVLIIGLFNFVNIYTVLMLRRSREVGVRKVFGAPYSSIIGMLYAENLVMILLALAGGWILAISSTHFTATVLGIPAVDNMTFNLFLTAAILVIIPIATTIHPYFKYKYAKPITSVQNINQSGKSIAVRAVLLVAQYVVTCTLIIISLYFVRQLDFMLSAPVGYNTQSIIKTQLISENFPYYETNEQAQAFYDNINKNAQAIDQTLNTEPSVVNWFRGNTPNEISTTLPVKFKIGTGEFKDVCYFNSSEKFATVCGIRLTEGRFFNDTVDKFNSYNMVVNRAFLRTFDIKDWQSAQMQSARRIWYSYGESTGNPPYSIIGVIEDFQIGHLKEQIAPICIAYSNSSPMDKVCVQTTPDQQAKVINILQGLHNKFGAGDFTYTTVESELEALYTEDKKITNVYTLFAIIAIFIGSLGLLSLSLYDVQQRRREIALRRVNGARIGEIMSMLLKKYYLLLAIAFIIAMPLAYFAIESYVADFANRAPISWWIFAIAAVITATISLLTLIWKIYRAATENPAIAMKTE